VRQKRRYTDMIAKKKQKRMIIDELAEK